MLTNEKEPDRAQELKQSFENATAYKNGSHSRCHVSVCGIPVPEYKADDVARTRKELNLSQRGLASALGVSTRTVEAWEAGKNQPSGAARNLLYLFSCDHSLVDRLVTR